MEEIKNTKAFYNTEIPSDWEETNINEMFYFKQGVQCAVDNQFEICTESRVRFIRIIDLTDSNEPIRYIDDPGKEHHLLPDDLFMIRYGTPGVLGYGYEGVIANNLFRIIPKTETNNHFYYYQLSFKERQIQKLASSSTMPALNFESLSQLKVLAPPLSEQKAIAQVLSTADAAIHSTEKLIAQKELRKKWLMQQLLTGKKRLIGFGGEWKEVKIGKLFKHIKNVNDGNNSHSIMTISSKLGLISQEDKFDRVIAGESLKKYTQLKKGDFAYNKGNSKTYQMGCIYQLEEYESALVPFVYICFSPTDLIDSKFYKHWYFAHGLDRQLKKIISSGARGDGLLNVNTEDFFKLTIIFPPKEEQTAIAQVLQVADKEIQLLKTKQEKLKEQKKGLMQVLLTGKKRLKINDT